MWNNLTTQIWRGRGALIAAPSVATIVLAARFTGILQPLELAAWDQFFRLRPLMPIETRVAVVGVNEADVRNYGSPVSDAVLAKLLERLKQQQPRGIGLDLYRDLPREPGHADLVRVFESTPNLIGIQKVVSGTTGLAVNPPPALSQRQQIGANDLVPDADLKIRRNLISLKDPSGKTLFSLGTQLALRYLKQQGIEPQAIDAKTGKIQLGKAILTPLQSNDGGYVSADAGGYQILANWRSLRQGFPTVSLTDVLEGRMPTDFARDRVVLIGVTAESNTDFFLTAYSNALFGRAPVRSSGVLIHADVVSQLLSAALDGHVVIRTWTEQIEALWIAGWAIVGAALSWTHRYRKRSLRKHWMPQGLPFTTVALLGLSAALVSGCYAAFLAGWWIPLVPALMTLLGTAIGVTAYTARSASELRQTFGRYLSDEIVANLLETSQGLKLGGEKRKVTILVSDLRGFSAISERVSPEKGVAIINLYLEAMTEVIDQHRGTINELLGDGMFILFGAPEQHEDDAQRAIACAIAMQLAMDALNERLAQMNLSALEMGIGLNTGEVLAGNIGSQRRAKYTVIGSPVNLAARIESYTVGGQVLASKETLKDAGPILRIDGQTRVQPKGFQEPITLYELGGIGGKFNLFLPKIEEELMPLWREIPLQWTIVEGKQRSQETYPGWIVKLSTHTAEVRANQPVDLLMNLQMSLLIGTQKANGLSDMYAKVIEKSTSDRTHFRIRFTAMPPEVAALFHYFCQSDKPD